LNRKSAFRSLSGPLLGHKCWQPPVSTKSSLSAPSFFPVVSLFFTLLLCLFFSFFSSPLPPCPFHISLMLKKCCDLLLPITPLILSIFLPALCSCSASSVQQSLSSHFLLHSCLSFHHVLLFFSCYLPLCCRICSCICVSQILNLMCGLPATT